MDATRAMTMLRTYSQPTVDPVLGTDELEALLADHAAVPDADEVAPSDAGWVPTYSTVGVWRAVAEAWTLKAGKASGRFDFTTDGQNFRRSQVLDHCEAMAAKYRRKVNLTLSTKSETASC